MSDLQEPQHEVDRADEVEVYYRPPGLDLEDVPLVVCSKKSGHTSAWKAFGAKCSWKFLRIVDLPDSA